VLKISNTLSGKLEEFHPLDDKQVRMYTCGPTVYDYAHIGNFRTFVFQDVLKRYLRFKGYQVAHVMNITDVDDKTIRNSGASNPAQLRAYTDQFTAAFFEDCGKLRIERPDIVAHATDHIPEMVALIQTLNSKGYTYEKDGSIYFRISQFKDYGKLSKLDAEGILAGARVDVDEYGKQDARDFVLWKATKNGEPHWETALGPGRPGWHVECSAMSMKYLGESFDLHCGAVDLVFPHHENEIAQSEAATEKPFVRYWMHGEHLIVEGEKMSKSKGNFYTLRDLAEKGIDPLAVRYALQSVPYRRQLNFTFDLLHQAGTHFPYKLHAVGKALDHAGEQLALKRRRRRQHADNARARGLRCRFDGGLHADERHFRESDAQVLQRRRRSRIAGDDDDLATAIEQETCDGF